MRITRTRLTEIVAQEVERRIREFTSDEDDTEGGGMRRSAKPGMSTADTDSMDPPEPKASGSDRLPPSQAPDSEVDSGDPGPEPGEADDESPDDKDDDALDVDGEAGAEPTGAVNDEVSGKTVQSITIEPKSKVLPGAKEIVLSFNESTDALRVLVTPTGTVKFFWRGQLHDVP